MTEIARMSSGYFHTHGPRLIELGYDIVPIKPGTKRPDRLGWQNIDYGAILAAPRHPRAHKRPFEVYGVGAKTKRSPAVDADTPSPWLIEQVADWCAANIGPTLARIGRPPRELFVFRTDEPFRKVKSDTFVSPDGNEHKLEVLADGQQFVAYGIHPGTGKPYYWPDQELLDTPKSALSLITQKQAFALVDYFNVTCAAAGWTTKARELRSLARRPVADPHAPLPLLAAAMSAMSIYPETYDRWIAVGAALYHATDGSAEGLELWDAWSMKSDTYGGGDCQTKWDTFAGDARSGAGTVFYWADRSKPDWRMRPDVSALFYALRAAQRPTTIDILNEALRRAAAKTGSRK
ncbi:PriCT-2 domain-containing protein [Mesorhizobium sp. L103C131B0]|uniref:PriCT-2 domain-containing protein n=1 Tax=Mesorhizobium sp. L103C131B0 TaxID=1287089 RepID=UPI0003CF9CD9|nr:PriCT-2 domain-containing protein [Mesorhizobium sp. L103C131B0]ESZ65924.1 hypothetical protein X729_02045 [Mesorhizobium sp. L103C131B0]